jgi:hypothetical protein
MRHLSIELSLLLTLVLAPVVLAPALAQDSQTPPNFSGVWVLRDFKTDAKRPAKPPRIVIRCSGRKIEMRSTWNVRESIRKYIVDGKEHLTGPSGVGQELDDTLAKASWENGTLVTVITTSNRRTGTRNQVTERWTLSGDGRTLTRSFDDMDLVFVYDKQ